MMATAEELKTTSLYYREGSSDKEYHVAIEAREHGYAVNFAYGRRGSTLSTGTKTAAPVHYDAALLIFEKLVREKKAKGYTEGADGTPYQHASKQTSGLLPQLLNSIDEDEASRLVSDPRWAMQEKLDGRRLMLRRDHNHVEGINKKGLITSIPSTVAHTALNELNGSFVIDGEIIGDTLHAFDLLFLNGRDLRSSSYERRYVALLNLLAGGLPKHIKPTSVWIDPNDKLGWLHTLKRQNAEGVVFKLLSAPCASEPGTGGFIVQ